MKHHAFAAMGLFTAAFLAQGAASHAASADPTGFWVKPGSERNAKIEVRKCGKGLCSKIVWLEDPNDSKGKPLRDIRNQNPSQRGRPILGLPIFTGLAPSAPGVWTGKIYNPEDGNTYSVTLTVVSRQQLKLKGCKSWLLCAERVWLRTAPPPAEPKPDETIEASVKPEAETAPAAPVEEAKAEPKAESPEPSVQASAAPNAPEPAEVAPAPAPAPIGLAAEEPVEMVAAPQETPTPNSSDKARSGYRFLNASAASENAAHYSGESVPSMFVMTKPVAADAVPASSAATATPAALQADETVPPPSPKPKPTLQAAASKPMLKPAPKPAAAKPTGQGAPAPLEAEQDADAAATELPPEQTQAAASETLAPPPLTRRQKRLLRRQQMGQQPIFPWLRPN